MNELKWHSAAKMKKAIRDSLNSIPECLWSEYPYVRSRIETAQRVEETIERAFMQCQRKQFILNSDPEIKARALRIFVHHRYVAATEKVCDVVICKIRYIQFKPTSTGTFALFDDSRRVPIG